MNKYTGEYKIYEIPDGINKTYLFRFPKILEKNYLNILEYCYAHTDDEMMKAKIFDLRQSEIIKKAIKDYENTQAMNRAKLIY